MSSQLGEAFIPIRATMDKLDGDLSQARGKIQGALGNIQGTLASLGKKAFIGITAGLAVTGTALVLAGKKAVSFGADANETASLLESSLGPAAAGLNDELRDFADVANRSFFELQAGSSTFVAMTKSMGATQDQAAGLGASFTMAATDLGSFFNVPTEQSLQDIQGALAGSSETLQKYGIDVRENTLKQMALDQGLITSATDVLPRLMRAQLLEQAILEQGSDAMGDAERTSDSWQNTMRGLVGRIRDITTETGQKLIPALTPLLAVVGDLAERAVPVLSNVLDTIIPIIENVAVTIGELFDNLTTGMEPLDAITLAIENLLGAEAAAWFQDTVAAIQEFIVKVQEVLQPVTDAIAGMVEWQDVAIAFAIAIGSVLIPVIWGILSPILAVIAVGAALVAAIAVVRTAWEEDWGGIRTFLVDTWNNHIMPAFEALRAWVIDVLIPTVTTLYEQWKERWDTMTTVLQNAWTVISAVWTEVGRWINDNLVPWIEFFREKWQENLEVAQGILENVWKAILIVFEPLREWLAEKIPQFVGLLRAAWETNILPMSGTINTVFDAVQKFFDAVKSLYDWLKNKVFSFKINLPNLPDWALPGSPLPIHTAWRDFERDMNRMVIAPQINLGNDDGRAVGSSTIFNINASYRNQNEGSLRDDIRLLQMLADA